MKMKVSHAIEKGLVERLDRICAISKESRSQVIERMIRDAIESAEQFADLIANPKARAMLMEKFADPEIMKTFAAAMGEKSSPAMSRKIADKVEEMGRAVQEVKKGKGKKS